MYVSSLFSDLLATAPLTWSVLLGLVVLLLHAFHRSGGGGVHGAAVAGLLGGAVVAAATLGQRGTAFGGTVLTGGYASLFALLFFVAAALTLLIARPYLAKIGTPHGEFAVLVLFAVSGMIVFSSALDLVSTFVGLEILSVCLYVLAGFSRRVLRANEASLKYFLLGAFATGFFLYGIALVYGATGSTHLQLVAASAAAHNGNPLFLAGVGLLLIGFGFKVGAAPFHMWVPDVYEGSPTVVSAFMSTGAKAAAFGALTLVVGVSFGVSGGTAAAVAVLAVSSMVLGNVVAVSQSNVKRLLAYSSIAHAGYMLVGIVAGSSTGHAGVLFYVVSYTLTNLGAFGVAAVVENGAQENTDISAFDGLGRRRPALALLMSVFLFSLIGLPPLSGFFGKYYIFVAAIEQGYTWLAIVGVITSMISAYYYLRVVVAMYFHDAPDAAEPIAVGGESLVPLAISAAGVLCIGLLPSTLLDLVISVF
jgi:NADH-quinone oxidoreductase subunit N